MTQRPHPDDPPRKDDQFRTEREEPATTGVEPSDAPASQAERTEADPTLTAPAASTGSKLTQPAGSDELPYVDDRLSKYFVGAIVAVFAAIFAYAVLFGGSGLLTPDRSPRPSRPLAPSVSPVTSPSGSPAASSSASPDASPSASPEASPSVSPAGSPSGSPAGSPSASPAASPSASPAGSPSASPSGSPASGSPSPAGS